MKLACWRSPKVIRRSGGLEGVGLFALEPIAVDELMAVKTGHIVDESYVKAHAEMINGSHVQISDNLFYAPTTEAVRSDILIGFNHSCEPNAYIDVQVLLRAMRSIEPGEEITVDYATYFTSDTMEFDCLCKKPSCRKHIKPSIDWKNPELQAKYKGYFVSFIQDKLNQQDEL
jgi:SET domain-containing protein